MDPFEAVLKYVLPILEANRRAFDDRVEWRMGQGEDFSTALLMALAESEMGKCYPIRSEPIK